MATNYYKVESVSSSEFYEIKSFLKQYFVQMGESFKWNVTESSELKIVFKSKFDWFWGLEEIISVDFSTPNIFISSYSPGNSPHISKMKQRNEDNCVRVINGIPSIIESYFSSDIEKSRKETIRQKELDEISRIELLKQSQNALLKNLDKDCNGEVDLVDSRDFNKLLQKYQSKIIEIDKLYIQKFVKISNYIKIKRQNTQRIFETIRETGTQEELNERVGLLKNQGHSYELLVFHSINMIGALVSEDLITFYEIYESFDKLGMFNSNWENEVSEKLTNIGDKLDDLMYSIYNMEQNIVNELNNLSYITQDAFEELSRSVTNQLAGVESSININNLLTGIQTYQLYKINKNTKSLRD